MPSEDYILVITGPKFTKLAWMACLNILTRVTGSNAEIEPRFLMLDEVKVFELV